VGVGSAAVDLTVLVLLIHGAGWTAWAANLMSRPCGGVFSFVFNKIWTFDRGQLQGTGGQLARYWIMWLCAYATSELLVWVFSRPIGWPALPSKIAAEGIVNALAFLVHRHWTFRSAGHSSEPSCR
jgi:putative flippase GtrA